MAEIILKSVSNYALKDVDLEVRPRETLAIVGVTGAGKTTLIKAIAGLVPFEGQILLNGRDIRSISIRQRGIGYLPQDLYLFPHMTVFTNIVYGLRGKGLDKREKHRRGWEVMEVMGISDLAGRYPVHLSGGEKQRVALARAIALRPEILLLDEPFSSLDVKTVKYLRLEFKRVMRELNLTTLFITHNLTEAEEMGDRLAIMEGGRILRVGGFSEIFFQPDHPMISELLGSHTILNCQSYEVIGYGLTRVETGKLSLIVPDEGAPIRKVAIASRHVYLSREKPPGPDVNRFLGVVEKVEREGSLRRLRVDINGEKILAEAPENDASLHALTPGTSVYVILRLRHLIPLQVQGVNPTSAIARGLK